MSLRIYGNRLLKTLPGEETRPTLARVREAVFNIWQVKIKGCCWLDLCTGSGSMGAEALCRGAAVVIGIEQHGKACKVIQENWQTMADSSQQIQVIRGDILGKLKILSGQKFDCIYFDPPYNSNLYQPVLEAISQYQLLSDHGEIAVEHHTHRWEIQPITDLEICREKTYGNCALTFYCLK